MCKSGKTSFFFFGILWKELEIATKLETLKTHFVKQNTVWPNSAPNFQVDPYYFNKPMLRKSIKEKSQAN